MTTGGRAAAVTHLFDQVAGVYDTALLQKIVYRPAQDEIIRVLRRREPARVVDVGCGTGILAARLAAELRPDAVYGCDLSHGMLAVARGRSERVAWINCPSEQLPLPDASLDAVVSSHAFHFFDQPAALAEFHRVLAPGGLAAVVVLNPRTPAGSWLVGAAIAGTGRFPHEAAMRRLFSDAGFVGTRQHRVRRGGARLLSPDVLTVGEKPRQPASSPARLPGPR